MGSNSCEQMLYCLKRICDPCKEHVDNKFAPLSERATNEFIPIRDEMTALMTKATEVLANKAYDQTDALLREGAILKGKISTLRKEQMDRIQERDVNVKAPWCTSMYCRNHKNWFPTGVICYAPTVCSRLI